MPYSTGFLEGFSGRRDQELQRNFERDAAQRQQEGKIYEYLLQSADPEMRALAMSGMLESARPGTKAKGLRGFMGEVQGGQMYPAVLARMNEMVPDEGPPSSSAPTPSASPGSAAMSTNQMTRPGSAPPQLPGVPLPPEPPPFEMGGGGSPLDPSQDPSASGAMPPPPAAPMESAWKRRGTGVPTAEEIAEANNHAQTAGRLKATMEALARAQNPEERDLIMALSGHPPPSPSFAGEPDNAILPDGSVVPVSRDSRTGMMLNGFTGGPFPPGTKMQPKAAGGGGSVPRTAKEPDPQSPTGWSKVFYDTATGAEMYRVPDTPFVPPPAYAGTTEIADPSNPRVPVRAPILRGGGVGPALGDVDQPVKAQGQLDAEALLAAVDDEVRLTMASTIGRTLGLSPLQRDQLVQRKAQAAQLPFQTYDELVRAVKAATPITTRERESGGSLAERVRARALQNRGGGGGGGGAQPAAPLPIPPPPAGPSPGQSNRSRGAGPVGR